MNDLIKRDTDSNFTQTATDEALLARDGKILNEKKVTGSVGSSAPTSSDFVEDNAVYFQYNATNNSTIPQTWLNAIYPVGSIYMSVNSTNPGTLFGGTWTQIQNTFLLAAGSSYTAGATGGTASHTHTTGDFTLGTNHIPAHTHGQVTLTGRVRIRKVGSSPSASVGASSGIVSTEDNNDSKYKSLTQYDSTDRTSQQININATHTHTSVGGGAAHNHGSTGSSSNMPPYLVVYVWKRTA